MDLQGRVIMVLDETSGVSKSGNPWRKKEWVIETFDQFPKKVKVQCFGEKAENINLIQGKDYILSVDVESREYNGRWYTDVNVYRYQEMMAPQSPANAQPQGTSYQQPAFGGNAPYGNQGGATFGGGVAFSGPSVEESDEDLPF